MTNPQFVYTTYIKTTPEKLWQAITNPEFTRQYWGNENISDWKEGSKWQHMDGSNKSNGELVVGEVIESNPPNRLVLSWASPQDRADDSIVTFEIEAIEDMVCLTVIHDNFKIGSKIASKIAQGWPRVLSSMKSFLETGYGLNIWAGYQTSHSSASQETQRA